MPPVFVGGFLVLHGLIAIDLALLWAGLAGNAEPSRPEQRP